MKLVFATNNVNKLIEVQKMLPSTIQLLSLKDIGCFDDIEETATTLEGNATIKANYITRKFGYNCFADDTGLEVESLQGAPGVYSARYAGKENNAEKNIQKLLTALQGQPNRNAQFRTAICLNLNGEQFLFEGTCKGFITIEKQGNNGFGYDPVFQPENFDVSFAEMTPEEKNSISHRGLAIHQLITFLKSIG
ncbi:non-canonical purine NTP diphosphatase [Tenacibaculum maritimum]|uniref:dITP/XTP pyrophosphatase n=1 Tax=Tenacibaculum maritimum NCIMB 2154 TaxID=1349785 RepID=A0A2H1EC50_9FLAO|nr:non-canonical purine NTP diphosphatase [Tenacibaculum maritimum]MCD9583156.1 non-canonical purine NTP diphosphatase [Tenacibaculum maritimum]MCD9610443.1 non-canonical purine NTP diphosphatase [Tenacibaculum maritimum]MCD9635994.1 non-canonical purine NTP diphosphatase [Tenacibaculum maritimum]QCD62673.1 non-canonical purine NTP pyrophosphatase [Tenacibaculum maritimum]CAA0143679.1 inosine/xanthosine triphosphate pyrophosphatase (subunit A) [Tenacibaculum maritimum]